MLSSQIIKVIDCAIFRITLLLMPCSNFVTNNKLNVFFVLQWSTASPFLITQWQITVLMNLIQFTQKLVFGVHWHSDQGRVIYKGLAMVLSLHNEKCFCQSRGWFLVWAYILAALYCTSKDLIPHFTQWFWAEDMPTLKSKRTALLFLWSALHR